MYQYLLEHYEEQDSPIYNALESDETVKLLDGGNILLAQFDVGRHSYLFTHHAIERLMERVDAKITSLFPHLDFTDPLHALFAGIFMVRQGKQGIMCNVKRKKSPCLAHENWLFPFYEAENGVRKVVTAYTKRSSTRFYAY